MPKIITIPASKQSLYQDADPKSHELKYRIIRRIRNIHKSKINFSIQETSQLVNMSYDFIRENIISGKIKAVHYGDRYMINIYELSRIILEGV